MDRVCRLIERGIYMGIKEIGRFNVVYAGLIYDGEIPYNMIIIEEFDDMDQVLGKKTYYFIGDLPEFEFEEEVEEVYSFPRYTKLQAERRLVVRKIF